jgi:hypothetical protein
MFGRQRHTNRSLHKGFIQNEIPLFENRYSRTYTVWDSRPTLVHSLPERSSITKQRARKPLFNKYSSDVALHKKMLDIFRNMPRIDFMLRRTNS